MQLADQIIAIYPQVTYNDFANGNIVLQDDGVGAYIKSWKYPNLTQPTATQLAAITSPSLALVQANQAALVNNSCGAAIVGGFKSSALGSPYTYPSTQNDQANLNANVVSSLLPNLPAGWTTVQMCCSASGVWAYVPHTAAQIQQVGLDGKAAIVAALTRNATLQAQIAAATTVAAVQAITF